MGIESYLHMSTNRLTSLDFDELGQLACTAVAPSRRITTNTNTTGNTGVDLSGLAGCITFLLNASAPEGALQTADFKLQHSDTIGGTYTDAGYYFNQVTTAGGPSFQKLQASPVGLKKFVRAVATLGGTMAAITFGITAIGKKPY